MLIQLFEFMWNSEEKSQLGKHGFFMNTWNQVKAYRTYCFKKIELTSLKTNSIYSSKTNELQRYFSKLLRWIWLLLFQIKLFTGTQQWNFSPNINSAPRQIILVEFSFLFNIEIYLHMFQFAIYLQLVLEQLLVATSSSICNCMVLHFMSLRFSRPLALNTAALLTDFTRLLIT